MPDDIVVTAVLDSEPKKEEPPMADMVDSGPAQMVFQSSMESHAALMHDSRANEQNAHSIARHSAVRKFDQVDPIEAAAVEMILGLSQV